ncbi:hypothetical protein [Streptomyces sp. MA5143a]|uniref:hypothetical protein n=1 Tax=Streptomyces sp. MA5143a TaxID=2083010 RepID=UPI000D1B77D4|nr:hypothetical protein [Streptomyces sp. MA5143a]SPF07279.1 hypothetical protein SMA5143A_8130 [Streptomyces sp. MA5143a]
MDDTAYVRQWGEEMARLAEAFSAGFEAVRGYPPGGHEVRLVSAEEGEAAVALLGHAGAAEALLEYYAQLGPVVLPDLGNGVWINDASSVVSQREAGNYPNRLTGAVDDAVTVFGTDGGGGLYAVSHTTGGVYHLALGVLTGDSYHLDPGGYRRVAMALRVFLEQLRTDLTEAVLAQRAAHSRYGQQ